MAGTIRSIMIAPNNTVYVHNLTAMNNDASSNVIYPRGEATDRLSAHLLKHLQQCTAEPHAAAWPRHAATCRGHGVSISTASRNATCGTRTRTSHSPT